MTREVSLLRRPFCCLDFSPNWSQAAFQLPRFVEFICTLMLERAESLEFLRVSEWERDVSKLFIRCSTTEPTATTFYFKEKIMRELHPFCEILFNFQFSSSDFHGSIEIP